MPLILLLVTLLHAPSTAGQLKPVAMEEDERLTTRYGPVILEKNEDIAPKRWRITLNGKTLAETEDDELGLWELFEGDDTSDYVIMRRSSGGIACPYQFRVIEAGPSGLVRVSEEFGSCLDPKKTRLHGNALVLEMSAHIPHPELLTAAELRRRRQTTEIYTVTRGRITMREEVRR